MQLKFNQYTIEGTPSEIADFLKEKLSLNQCKSQQVEVQTSNTIGQSIGSSVKKD